MRAHVLCSWLEWPLVCRCYLKARAGICRLPLPSPGPFHCLSRADWVAGLCCISCLPVLTAVFWTSCLSRRNQYHLSGRRLIRRSLFCSVWPCSRWSNIAVLPTFQFSLSALTAQIPPAPISARWKHSLPWCTMCYALLVYVVYFRLAWVLRGGGLCRPSWPWARYVTTRPPAHSPPASACQVLGLQEDAIVPASLDFLEDVFLIIYQFNWFKKEYILNSFIEIMILLC
jgi:hypothetical protein